MSIVIINKPSLIDYKSWALFVHNHPHGNAFQTPEMYQVYQYTPLYEPILIAAKDNEKIVGVLLAVVQKEYPLPWGFLSARSIIWGGPLVQDNDENILDMLLQAYDAIAQKKAIYSQFRNLWMQKFEKKVFEKNGFEYKEHFNFIVKIDSAAENFKKLNENRRRQIKKSLKSGVEIVNAKEMSEVKEFYSILNKLYKEKVKKPLPTFSFFEQFFLMPDLGKYFLVKLDEKIIGGTMCPILKDVIYEWYECALDKEFKINTQAHTQPEHRLITPQRIRYC